MNKWDILYGIQGWLDDKPVRSIIYNEALVIADPETGTFVVEVKHIIPLPQKEKDSTIESPPTPEISF